MTARIALPGFEIGTRRKYSPPPVTQDTICLSNTVNNKGGRGERLLAGGEETRIYLEFTATLKSFDEFI
ncbi:hypothetical protein NDU88_005610 [Pleurodeles waltl]|uniref:Uncharacterized protein n=1 Tax=Pleurodeles waltl TaxID=8319 RepID=A0AAV7WXJ6_PLEWA|nr:hypothetical protein NDU88_005610 [Pleurodeles waltl]